MWIMWNKNRVNKSREISFLELNNTLCEFISYFCRWFDSLYLGYPLYSINSIWSDHFRIWIENQFGNLMINWIFSSIREKKIHLIRSIRSVFVTCKVGNKWNYYSDLNHKWRATVTSGKSEIFRMGSRQMHNELNPIKWTKATPKVWW